VPTPNGNGARTRTPPVADPAKVPAWQQASARALESAAAENRPIVVFFEGERSTDFDLYGEDFAELSATDAMFMKVAYTDSREKSPWAEDSVVPTCKLLSDNPSRDYGIDVGKPTVVVCDWHGNEFFRTDHKVKAPALKAFVEKVAKQVESTDKKLQRHVDKARQDIEKDNQGNALKNLLKAFEDGYVGLDSVVDATRMYHEIIDDLRDQKDKLLEEGDANGLRELARIVKKTDLEKEVDEAIKSVK
jgi:hypothetical protein